MTFHQLFPRHKAVIAMLHLKGCGRADRERRAEREIEIFYRCGVDAVLVENYFGDLEDCRWALDYLSRNYSDRVYGVNILGSAADAFALAETYGAQFIQIDSVCGHLRPVQEPAFVKKLEAWRAGSRALVLGGVRFKYQPVRSGRTLEEDLRLGMERCDAVVVTGEGTGLQTPPEKIARFRETLGTFPLITGAGVTGETAAQTLAHSDGIIVGSWLKTNHKDSGEVCEDYVRALVRAAGTAV